MTFFNKMLASIGIGAANVDTKLEKSSYQAGELLRGEVEVYGGNVEQEINTIYLTLYTNYIKERDDYKFTVKAPIQKFKVSNPFTIGVNERKVIPFSIDLPYDLPITIGKSQVWIATELDIKSGLDSEDKDFIEIRPSKLAEAVLSEIQNLGFRLREVENEETSLRFIRKYPFIQEFEFVPVAGPFRGRLDELEITFLSQTENNAEIYMQVDRRARGLSGLFAEALEMDESYVRLNISKLDLSQLNTILYQTISKYA